MIFSLILLSLSNMNYIKRIIVSIVIATIISPVFSTISAQSFDQANVKVRVAERVQLMNDYISYMADKKNNYETRQYYRKKALPLFIGKGYKYISDGIEKDGVLMQTTSTNNGNVKTQLIRNYFSKLIDLKYSDIKITSTKAANIKVSDLKKIGREENGNYIYECTCEYEQYFYGYRDGKLVYKDKTTKRISCRVEVEETEDGVETIIRLGDVEAVCTEKV